MRRTVLLVAQSSFSRLDNPITQAEQEELDKFIRILKKRGAKAKEWREENGVFVRHRTPSNGLRAQKCTIL